jgi:hypothetical protein
MIQLVLQGVGETWLFFCEVALLTAALPAGTTGVILGVRKKDAGLFWTGAASAVAGILVWGFKLLG